MDSSRPYTPNSQCNRSQRKGKWIQSVAGKKNNPGWNNLTRNTTAGIDIEEMRLIGLTTCWQIWLIILYLIAVSQKFSLFPRKPCRNRTLQLTCVVCTTSQNTTFHRNSSWSQGGRFLSAHHQFWFHFHNWNGWGVFFFFWSPFFTPFCWIFFNYQ